MNTSIMHVFCSLVISSLLPEISSDAAKYQNCDDKYTSCEKIQDGSDGTVYRCAEKGTSRQVALKHFGVYSVFENEVKRTKQMKNSIHPELFLELLDTCVSYDNGQPQKPVAVFELLRCDLSNVEVDFNFNIRSVSLQIITAVSTMHKMNLIHRDVKVENIGLSGERTQNVKLIDLASAEEINSEHHIYGFVGTPQCMAPEILIGESVDKAQSVKGDVWAVGVTLLEFATGDNFVEPKMMDELVGIGEEDNVLCFGMFIYIYNKCVLGLDKLTETEIKEIQRRCDKFSESTIQLLLSSTQVITYKESHKSLLSKAEKCLKKYFGLNNDETEQFIQLVQWLLTFDFHTRPTVEQAASHKFFDKLSTETDLTKSHEMEEHKQHMTAPKSKRQGQIQA